MGQTMLKIQPQDRGQPTPLTINFPARLFARLRAAAEVIDSEVDYVVIAILDEELPPLARAKPAVAANPKNGAKP